MSQSPASPGKSALSLREHLRGLIDAGRFAEAAEVFAALRSLLKADPQAAGWEAEVELGLGRPDRALELALEPVRTRPQELASWRLLLKVLKGVGRDTDAPEALVQAGRTAVSSLPVMLEWLDEAIDEHGFDAATPLYEDAAARFGDPVRTAWAKRAFAAERDDRLPMGMASARVISVRAWLAAQGRSPEFDGAPEVLPFEAPQVFGEPHPSDTYVEIEGYSRYACTIPDATILAGSSLVFAPDGAALNDTVADPRYGRFLSLSFDKTIVDRAGERMAIDVSGHSLMQLDAAVMLSGWASAHFGHWVPEYLCRLAYLEQHPRFAELPIVVDAGMPPQHLEYLRALVPNEIVVLPERHALRCGELVVGSPATFYPVLLDPDHEVPFEHQGGLPLSGLRYLQDRVARSFPPSGTDRGRKLYLSRQRRQWRLVENEAEVVAAMAARGFEILFPEDMSFEEQVRMYQSASVVVAPNGSSLLNAIHARNDLKMIVLSQPALFSWSLFSGPMRALGYNPTFFCGEGSLEEKHAGYRIPVDRLIEAVEG